MRVASLLSCAAALSAGLVAAIDSRYFWDKARLLRQQQNRASAAPVLPAVPVRATNGSVFHNANTTKFAVQGDAIPDVDFDAGESYAGQLPIGGDSDGQLFFWFWPTTNTDEPQEILIWLNGGPGCSSLEGLLQENGPISWQAGTYAPVRNPWSWHHLTNVVYIEQPVGTGFSTGTVTARNEDDVADQFMGFWRHFVDTFGLHGYKVFITGESYAGMYCPYIASHFLDANDTTYFDVRGMHIYDPVITNGVVGSYIPANYFVDYWQSVLPLNQSARAQLRNMSASCGFDDYLDTYLTFPPPADPQPAVPPGLDAHGTDLRPECATADLVIDAALELNPGWNIYQVAQLLPVPSDVLGFPYTGFYVAPGERIYFDRDDVKRAIHAPADVRWSLCSNDSVFAGEQGDTSPPSADTVLGGVVDRTRNVQVTHGLNDFVLVANGTLLALQNLTWGGQRGFQALPASPLFVPHHPIGGLADDGTPVAGTSGQGVLGTTHSERGLTWSLVALTGHMVPGWQAAVAFRQTEVLLGRVANLSSTQPLSVYATARQPSPQEVGGGVGPVLGRAASQAEGGKNSSSGSSGNSTAGGKKNAAAQAGGSTVAMCLSSMLLAYAFLSAL